MPNPIVIGLAGQQGSGKTYLAQYLSAERSFFRHSFAAPLKAALVAMGMPKELLIDKNTPSAFLCGRTSRYAMQTLGTEWGRDMIGQDFWAAAWNATLPRNSDGLLATSVVADDVRFLNEIRAVRENGGIVIYIVNPNAPPIVNPDHASETLSASSCDATFVNDTHGVGAFAEYVKALIG